jgi:hypothetical protein
MEIKKFEINTDKKKPHVASFSVSTPMFTLNRMFILKRKKENKYFWIAPAYKKSNDDKINYPIVDFGDRFQDFRREVYRILEPYFKQLDEAGV